MPAKRKYPETKKPHNTFSSFYIIVIVLVSLIYSILFVIQKNFDYRSVAQIQDPSSIKLRTMTIPPISITITYPPTPVVTYPYTTPPVSNYNPPPGTGTKQYCVDEAPGKVTIESCDDCTRCDIAHGAGGPYGTCGTVISWEHNIIEFLLGSTNNTYNNSLSNNLSAPIQSLCHTAASISPYISTFNVIDAYNLAGLNGFSRSTHAAAQALETAWKSAIGNGFTILPGSAHVVTPGDVIFFNNPPHVAIVNTIEVDAHGNGDIWFLHTGTTYYLGKLIVAIWHIAASSTGDTAVTYGSHVSKGADATQGETVCYCGSCTNICYQYTF